MTKKDNQSIPIILAVVVFLAVVLFYFLYISTLNLFPGEKIQTVIHWQDVLVGLTIYLKTSVDFALLIGLLMKQFPGVKNRIAIETGTAVGNALGTIVVLTIWYFFKEVVWLLAGMIFLASVVLLKLAQTSLDHVNEADEDKNDGIEVSSSLKKVTSALESFLNPINKLTAPVLSKIVPDLSFKTANITTFMGLVASSFSIPFILGLDDFAGYVPLFNVVNVFGFGTGVFLGHMVLNLFLFINPDRTIKIVKNPIIGVIGSIVFVGLALWGFYEVFHILEASYFHHK